jgi:hypothetical protein
MAEAQALSANGKSYSGLSVLYDLNDGLFAELDAPQPKIDLYRRELQRAYVTQILARVEGQPSEFRAALRRGAGDLQQKIDKGLKKTKDGVTAAHLYDLTVELDRVH